MKIYFIRHGKTSGNAKGRYVGTTDESILESEKTVLMKRSMMPATFIFASPMLRCRQTCELLYPDQAYEVISDFREMDFGDFEYKSYQELDGNVDYQFWVDRECKSPIPNGESKEQFAFRCTKAFEQAMEKFRPGIEKHQQESVAFIVHGGTIMSILEAFAKPKQDYFSWQVSNGSGFEGNISWENDTWVIRIESKIDS